MKSGDGFDRLAGATNGAQERKIVGGSQQISTELAKRVPVQLSSPVQAIAWDPEMMDRGVTVTLRDGRSVQARHIILALSPTLWRTITFNPALPDLHSLLSQRMPMGSIIKTTMYYKEAFWRKAGYRVSPIFACLP